MGIIKYIPQPLALRTPKQGAHDFETGLVYLLSSVPAQSYTVKLSKKKLSPKVSYGDGKK